MYRYMATVAFASIAFLYGVPVVAHMIQYFGMMIR